MVKQNADCSADFPKLLLQDPRARDNLGSQANHYVLRNGGNGADMLEPLLQDPRVDPNATDALGRTPFKIARGECKDFWPAILVLKGTNEGLSKIVP